MQRGPKFRVPREGGCVSPVSSFESTLTSVLHLDTSFLVVGQTTTGTIEWLSHCLVLTYHLDLDDVHFIVTHTSPYNIYLS